MRLQPDDPIFFRVADDPDRIASSLYGLDGFFIQAPQENYPAVRVHQVFRRPVVDRSLAFLRHPILISSGKPTDGFIPPVDAELSLAEPRRRVVFHDAGNRLAVDDSAELYSEVH